MFQNKLPAFSASRAGLGSKSTAHCEFAHKLESTMSFLVIAAPVVSLAAALIGAIA
jgi:hypothetical protein